MPNTRKQEHGNDPSIIYFINEFIFLYAGKTNLERTGSTERAILTRTNGAKVVTYTRVFPALTLKCLLRVETDNASFYKSLSGARILTNTPLPFLLLALALDLGSHARASLSCILVNYLM